LNLLLFEDGELDADGRITLRDRRAEHLRSVLRVEPGQKIRAGMVNGPSGDAEVESLLEHQIVLRFDLARATPPRASQDVLLLAVPRPKVLLRILEHSAALGMARIMLLRTWRVEKSHLQSRAMDPDLQRRHLLLGLEQARRTQLPEVSFHPLFRPFVEDVLPTLTLPTVRVLGHPTADRAVHDLDLPAGAPVALAVGPDGGFQAYEVERLAEAGFQPTSLTAGPHGGAPLRTEAAAMALWAQLDLRRGAR
jgi:16S rRNA (uracil1498-N3)-methyltransferase